MPMRVNMGNALCSIAEGISLVTVRLRSNLTIMTHLVVQSYMVDWICATLRVDQLNEYIIEVRDLGNNAISSHKSAHMTKYLTMNK